MPFLSKEEEVMKMLEVVRKLQEQGHKVEYYVRKDGGILIKRIDSQRFTTGASGNIMARSMAGVEISEARSSQLKYATASRKTIRNMAKKHFTLEDEIKQEWQRVKKKWNKAFKAKEGKPHHAGYFGWSRIKYSIEHYGHDEAMRRIREAEKYASGIAYEKNVKNLAVQILKASDDYDSSLLKELAQDLIDNAYTIKEEWIDDAYQALYKLNKGVSTKEVVKNVRKILRL